MENESKITTRSSPLSLEIGGVTLQVEGGLLTLTADTGRALLENGRAAVELTDGTRYDTTVPEVSSSFSDGSLEVRVPGDSARPALHWLIKPGGSPGAIELRLEVSNTGARELLVERLVPLRSPTGFLSLPLGEVEVLQTGWQSWSPAHGPVRGDRFDEAAAPPVLAPALPPREAAGVDMPWVTVLRATDGPEMLAGFVTAHDQNGVISLSAKGEAHCITAACYAEGLALKPGETISSETLLLIFNHDTHSALDIYARTLAEEMCARRQDHVPTGWCSWYYFFTDVTEQDILGNLDLLAARRDRLAVEYVQIDDGYQTHVGDWLTVNEKFPSGMRFLADEIRRKGFKPGIWLAPFLVSERSAVYAERPDWVLKDEQGEPRNVMSNWGTRNFALDFTNQAVEQWLRHVIGTIAHEWGYDYLKIDFIYAGMLRGARRDNGLTSVQVYRRALEMIREIAGDRFILGCGAPFAPSVGLVDGMRVGPDVAPYWRELKDPNLSAPAMLSAIRSTLAHGWMHGRLWANDPDCLLFREHHSELTRTEVLSWASVVAMSGGMALLSDDMRTLEPHRAALVPLVLPPLGQAAVPMGHDGRGVATRLALSVEREWESWLVAAMFNWQDEPAPAVFDPSKWGLAAGEKFHLFDLWNLEHRGPCGESVSLGPLEAHGVRLLTVHRDLGRPQLVGTTLHLLGGAVELVRETWTGDSLVLELACPGERTGQLAVYVPEGFELLRGRHVDLGSIWRGRVLLVPLRLKNRADLVLEFTRRTGSC